MLCLCLLASLLSVAAVIRLAALEPNDPLLGTWVNPEYEGSSAVHAKLTTFPDGRELGYGSVTSEDPDKPGRMRKAIREWVWSGMDHPEELSPIGGTYCIYRRQE